MPTWLKIALATVGGLVGGILTDRYILGAKVEKKEEKKEEKKTG